jgi:hypothetical protein
MATTPTRRKRPSRAAVARLRAEIEARPHHRELSGALAGVIDDYRSARVSDETMEKVKPFLRAAVTASTLSGAESVRKHCNHLSQLAAFAIERGRPLSIEDLLTTTFIDEYVRVGMAEADDHLRAERRRRLLSVARAANPGPDVPAKLTPIGYSSIKPCYTPAQLAVIVRACQVQPTAARQRDLAIVVALAAGAGLDSVDMRDQRTNHIEDLAEDGIRIHVQGPRPRTVILRAGLEPLLRTAIAVIPDGELVLGRKQDRRNTAARAVERAALHNVPHIKPARLRATWFADLMTDPIPLAVILQAAGLKSARTLSELHPHLGPWLEHKNLTQVETTTTTGLLRGESGA